MESWLRSRKCSSHQRNDFSSGSYNINTCSIAQYAALEAISGPQDSVESMRVEFDKRRKFLVERLNSMDGITCNNADGAFYLMPNMTAFYDKEWNGKKIADSFGMADYLLAEAKIAVVRAVHSSLRTTSVSLTPTPWKA